VTDVGRYINVITVSSTLNNNEEAAAMMASYIFHVYPGVYVIFQEESTNVTLEYEGTAVERNAPLGMQLTGAISNAQPSSVAAVMPRARRP
jgi:hypothetical protein